MQVHSMAAARDLGHIGRTVIVDIELHGLLGILGLYMHVLDRKGQDRSPYRSPAARHDHDIALGFGQRASLSEASADLAVKCSERTAKLLACAAGILGFFPVVDDHNSRITG